MIIEDKRENTDRCSDCKNKKKDLVWRDFRFNIYQDYPEPCRNCLSNTFIYKIERFPYYEKED